MRTILGFLLAVCIIGLSGCRTHPCARCSCPASDCCHPSNCCINRGETLACQGEIKIVLYLSSDGRFLRAYCPQAEKRLLEPDASRTRSNDDKDDRLVAPMPESGSD